VTSRCGWLVSTVVLTIFVVACASRHAPATTPPHTAATPSGSAAAPSAPGAPAGGVACVENIAFDGDPNGLLWDAAHARLVVTDSAHARLLAFSAEHGVSVLADIPPDEGKAGASLGQPVLDDGGELLVTRFGNGVTGGIVRIDANGTVGSVSGLDPERRRIGLASAEGRLFETYFVKKGAERAGGVAEVRADGPELDVASFQKPVGVVAAGGALYVSDQDQNAIFRCATTAGATCTRFATLTKPDLLAVGPHGSLFTGGRGGELRQIDRAGAVERVVAGSGEIRGVAWDGARRVFFTRRAADGRGVIGACLLP
jgi:hypothetical protein